VAHFAVIAPPLRGHYSPLSSLAEELVGRGHRATFVHQEEARHLVTARGADFRSVGTRSASLESWTSPMAKMRGVIGLESMVKRMADFTTMLCAEAPSMLRHIGADAVIADQLEPAGGMVAEHLGFPCITAAAALPMNREMSVPPPFVPWQYDPSERGLRRNRSGWWISDLLLRKVHLGIRRNAAALNLPARSRMDECFSRTLQISQLVPGLDFPRQELPTTFHYTGPWRRSSGESFPLSGAERKGTVFCSLGTLQGRRTKLFRQVAQACDELDLRLVITTGGRGSGTALEGLPGSTQVFDWVPQAAVIAQADLVVTHGGMNTVLDALAQGRPTVVMPLVFEQPATAARIAYSGAGLGVTRRLPIREAIRQATESESIKARARIVAKEISSAGGATRAADLIEALVGRGERRGASTTARAARDDARDDIRNGSSSAETSAS
jgi:MGT family glycosyltransferase